MSDALTTAEVSRLCRRALGELAQVPVPIDAAAKWRNHLDRASEHLNELLLLVDLVENVDAGLAVIVERDELPA